MEDGDVIPSSLYREPQPHNRPQRGTQHHHTLHHLHLTLTLQSGATQVLEAAINITLNLTLQPGDLPLLIQPASLTSLLLKMLRGSLSLVPVSCLSSRLSFVRLFASVGMCVSKFMSVLFSVFLLVCMSICFMQRGGSVSNVLYVTF